VLAACRLLTLTAATHLQRAVLLRAIRQRYEMGRTTHPGARCFAVQIVGDGGDMPWITAAIEALEKTIAAG